MYLTFRAAKPADFPQCFNLIFERYLFETPEAKKNLFSFWRKVLADRSAVSAVAEDRERPANKRIVGFGMGLFITDELARKVLTDLPPLLAPHIIRRWRQGKNLFLSRREIARDNAGKGLNQLTFNYGVERQKDFSRELQIRGKMFEAFLFTHVGYQMKQTLQEIHAPEEVENLQRAGLTIRRDFKEFRGKKKEKLFPQTFLMGAERAEKSREISLMAPFFFPTAPRFGFSPGEQDVLEGALLGGLDRNTARSMGLTVWAVKKRWQSIYEKVEKGDPSLLEASTGKSDKEWQKVRRKLLLDYLRSHLEELRPYDPAPHRGKKTARR